MEWLLNLRPAACSRSPFAGEAPLEEFLIEVLQPTHHPVEVELLLLACPAPLAHGGAPGRVAEDFPERPGQDVGIARWDEEPMHAVFDEVGRASDVRGNHRLS